MHIKDFSSCKQARKIENLRAQMVETAMEKGLNHPSTIQLSQQLDRLLNSYNKKTKLVEIQSKQALHL